MPSLSQIHRPRRFADVTGQQHVTETLRREVAKGLLAHAYVFSGPRGVGKTTCARIFAQALNCRAPQGGEPCGACSACQAMGEGRLLDVIELDAATHTGVETVREAIIEHVRFAPTFGKAKVYILDEAHMLSASSWNALLKTLEEPPAYAYFILATTEWHKVPATILSRCQRFEFKRVADEVLAARVRELAKREGWAVSDEVARLIVSRADGCVRDAETLLGQLGALGEANIDIEVASLVIPPTHVPLAAGLVAYWVARNHGAALSEARRLVDEGVAVLPLFDDLLLIIRRLLQASALPELAGGWSQGTVEERAMAPLVGRFSPMELHDVALMLMERRKDVKGGVDPLFALELASTMVACGMLNKNQGSPLKAVENQNSVTNGNTDVGAVRQPADAALAPPAMHQPSMVASDLSVAPTFDLAAVRLKWNAIIRAVDDKNHSLPFILKISRPEEVQGETLVIRFQYPFHKDKIVMDVKNRHVVEACAATVLGVARITLEGIVGEDAARTKERHHDMVTNILQAFGGQVVEPGA